MKKLLWALLLVVMTGCNKEVLKPKKVYLRSYVMYYYEIGGITLEGYPAGREISFVIESGSYIGGYEDSDLGKRAAYDALCEKHNDMSYNRTVRMLFPDDIVSYIGVDVVSIDITSNANFDAAHLAGSSLSDIVSLNTYSAQPYIDNEYVEHDWGWSDNYYERGNKPYYPVRKKISEITAKDLALLGAPSSIAFITGFFKFESLPTLSKSHTFTITFSDNEGGEYSASIEMVLE